MSGEELLELVRGVGAEVMLVRDADGVRVRVDDHHGMLDEETWQRLETARLDLIDILRHEAAGLRRQSGVYVRNDGARVVPLRPLSRPREPRVDYCGYPDWIE